MIIHWNLRNCVLSVKPHKLLEINRISLFKKLVHEAHQWLTLVLTTVCSWLRRTEQLQQKLLHGPVVTVKSCLTSLDITTTNTFKHLSFHHLSPLWHTQSKICFLQRKCKSNECDMNWSDNCNSEPQILQ